KDPVVHGDERDAKHERDGQSDPFSESGIPEIERKPVANPGPRRANYVDQEDADETADHASVGQRGDPDAAGEQDSAQDDPATVKQGADRREQEHPSRE